MPLKQMPTFKPVSEAMFEIAQPGIGGLNLKDLEFEQESNQTPYMMNMMYRNGSFSKRYGQEVFQDYGSTIYASTYYNGELLVHAGTNFYKGNSLTPVASNVPAKKGLFVRYAQNLYYLCNNKFYVYNEDDGLGFVDPYVPNVYYNCRADGSYHDVNDDFNILTEEFTMEYNGDGETKVFKIVNDEDNKINWNINPVVEVNDVETTAFTLSSSNKTLTFTTAPATGTNNVVMKWTLKTSHFRKIRAQLLSCKYSINFGGNSGSRVFLAGGGDSMLFYSNSYDATYFPENNWEILGNSEEDITGFGAQYNVLIVFKPNEIYSMTSFTESSYTTTEEEKWGLEGFKSQLVNAVMGCDAPYSIQLINNQLTWFSSTQGVCTLVSTNILDERNVRVISRNIDKTDNFGVVGILDIKDNLTKIQSVDYDNKYFLVFPTSGKCFMWDYLISPYYYSNTRETATKVLDWFLFNNFYVGNFIKLGTDLYYASSNSSFNTKIIKINEGFSDLDFNGDGEPDGINAYYMTPFLQFNAVAYLKNVKNIYVQCRGDTSSIIDMYYYTEESSKPEHEEDSIRLGGRLWNKFAFENFQWLIVNWANTFRRKCSLKKIQMASFYFENVDSYTLYNNDEAIQHFKSYDITIRGHYDTYEELAQSGIKTNSYVYGVGDGFYIYYTINGVTGWYPLTYNTVADRDMSISHIALQYSIVKNIK